MLPAMLLAFQQEPEATFKSDVNLVSLSVDVTDRHQQRLPDLSQSDFTVTENGRPQQIRIFSHESPPLSIGILLDSSSSMWAKLDRRTAASSLVKAIFQGLHPESELFALTFNTEVHVISEFTGKPLDSLVAIDSVSLDAGTSLYDALVAALCRFAKARYQRQALVVITDGADQHSHRTLAELIQQVQRAGAQVYMIGLFYPFEVSLYRESGATMTLVSGQAVDNPAKAFERLAVESGAAVFYASSGDQLERVADNIREELRNQYYLGYYSGDPGSQPRRISVKVRQRGTHVRTRRMVSAGKLDCDTTHLRPHPYEAHVATRQGKQVYSDDFADPSSGWPRREVSNYGKGGYYLTFTGGAQSISPVGQATLSAYGPFFNDVRVSATLKTSRLDDRGGQREVFPPAGGVVCRLNEGGYYAGLISQFAGSHGFYVKVVKKRFREPDSIDLTSWIPAQSAGDSSEKKISLECSASSIRVFVNRQLVQTTEDKEFSEGLTGIVHFGQGVTLFQRFSAEEISPR
jgi:Ca-activated chloride channel family protein